MRYKREGRTCQRGLKFVRGSKGNPKLLLGGFSYFKNNSKSDRTYWLCSRNRYLKCKARIITKASTKELVLKNQCHNHGIEYTKDEYDHDDVSEEDYYIVDEGNL